MNNKYQYELVGKMHGFETYIFKLKYNKSTKKLCQHCGNLSRKTWHVESDSAIKPDFHGNVFWCSTCAAELDLSEDDVEKFKEGQRVYYLNSRGDKIKGKVLFYSSDKYVEVEIVDSYGYKCRMGVNESELFNFKK